MKRMLFPVLILLATTRIPAQNAGVNSNINQLLATMSREEKIGQMMQLDLLTVTVPNSSPIRLDEAKLREALVKYKTGSFINNGLSRALSLEEWRYVNETIQNMILTENQRPVPLLYGIDSIHGATFVLGSTLFPQNLAMAATRDPELMRQSAHISAMETRAAGLRWTFAPVLDVARQPLWARFAETYGEDPHMASVFGAAAIQGFEGDGVGTPTTVAACMKHYLGYSFPLNGKDRSPSLIPESYLREYFMPPFRAATQAGVKTVMVNSGEINGEPVHASKYLLNDVLRGELGFKGVIVSDWEDVIRLHTWHHVAATPAEAVRMAVDAGLDISMVPMDFSFAKLLKQLVDEGRVSDARLDESVRRILQLKADVGLFNSPQVEPEATANFGKPEYHQTALAAAESAITLLKNDSAALPLAKTTKVLVTGPAAKSLSALHGCWSYTWQGRDEKWYPKGSLTVADALAEKLGQSNVLYRQGVKFDGAPVDVDGAVADAANADAIILCLGEDAYAETPGDINDLALPAGQQELAKRLYGTGKPVVVVLLEGRPRVIREIVSGAKGIVLAYWPGSEGARAIANVLFGDTNPSGKLPFTYPRYANHFITYDRKTTARLDEDTPVETMNPVDFTPQYEFGHGLSYTTFETKNLRLSCSVLKGSGELTATVEVTNTGKRTGQEVVELYSRQPYASLAPPLKRLRAFKKISLQPGETVTVSFSVTAADLAIVNAKNQLVTEPCDFEVMVGNMKAGFRFEA
jgi:beta-glucosidase